MTFKPTQEQINIVSAATETSDNLLISALAGAAKSSTLELIGRALPNIGALVLAFNKKIADELKPRLPERYTVKTLNALGHAAWRESIGKKLFLDDDKDAKLLKSLIGDLDLTERDLAWESFPDLIRAIKYLKSAGYVPDKLAAKHKGQPLVTDAMLDDHFEVKFADFERDLIYRTCFRSCELAFEGTIDFSDQLLMPTVFRGIFLNYPLIMVDEAQDLSELNHRMLEKLIRGRNRLIAVGDQRQAIYAFRGAHEEGMDLLRRRFNMTELTLSTTFRCPTAVVEHVRWRAPHMQAWADNPNNPGVVRELPSWSLSSIEDGDTIICRNNAPLLGLALALLRSGRYPYLWGNDITKTLVSTMKKLGPESMSRQSAIEALAEWRAKQEKRVKNLDVLEDKYQSILLFFAEAKTLKDAIRAAETVFRAEGRINLLTGHKSKGFEWPKVYFLDEELVRDKGQDPNLRYVIATRAKRELIYINSKERELPET